MGGGKGGDSPPKSGTVRGSVNKGRGAKTYRVGEVVVLLGKSLDVRWEWSLRASLLFDEPVCVSDTNVE